MPTGSGFASSTMARARPRSCAAHPMRRTGMKGRLRAGRRAHPENRHGARRKHDPQRRLEGHADVGAELALGEDHSGIIELAADAPVGTSYAALLGLDDPVIDLKVTPNRADCLGVRGIAATSPLQAWGGSNPRHDPGRGSLPLARCHPYRNPTLCPCFSAAISASRGEPLYPPTPPTKGSGEANLGPWSSPLNLVTSISTAAPCIRRREARGRPDRARRPARREAPRA